MSMKQYVVKPMFLLNLKAMFSLTEGLMSLLLLVLLLVLLLIVPVQQVHAVDANRIWLPKKYQEVKPKLMKAARDAESTERCVNVVAGEMIVRKNTAEHYYFIVTCRDAKFKTYNLTYHYPVAGSIPELIAEQLSPQEQAKQQDVEIEDGVDEAQALTLCQNEMATLIDEMDAMTVIAEEVSPVDVQQGLFHYQLPFTTRSGLGSAILYRGDCIVSPEGDTTLDIVLEDAGALAICRDSLRSEAILYGRIDIVDEAIEQQSKSAAGDYIYHLPFDVKNRIGTVIRYGSTCQVNQQGESEVHIYLQQAGAMAVCKDGLRSETLLMRDVVVAEEASKQYSEQTESGEQFGFEIPFTASDPDGNTRNFKASCQVDEEGEAEVVTSIDKESIMGVCIADVKRQTQKMIDVKMLEDQLPPLKQGADGGYVATVYFDARNPGGRALHYQAECIVDGTGRTTIKLEARR